MKLEWSTCLKAGLTVVITYLVIHYWGTAAQLGRIALSAAVPIFLGLVVAYVLNIPMSFFERRLKFKRLPFLKRPVCIGLAIASILAVIALVTGMVLPELGQCIRLLLEKLPGVLTNLFTWLETSFSWDIPAELIPSNWTSTDWESLLSTAGNWLFSGIGGTISSLAGAVTGTISAVVTIALCLVFALYLLANKDTLHRQVGKLVRTYLGEDFYRKSTNVFETVNSTFHSFVVGQCVEAVILGSLCIIGMWIFRFPYASMIGTLVGFTALIPIAGAYIGASVGALMILTESPLKAVLFIIFLCILQQMEGDFIYPRVVGSSIGLPGIWVMAAVTVGGGVMGIPGMLLGVPLAASVYKLLGADVARRDRLSAAAAAPVQAENPPPAENKTE